jgi:hypothetical protein
MDLTPGTRMRSVSCTTEIIVIAGRAGELTCDGQRMIPKSETDASPAPPRDDPANDATLLGKRYRTPDGTVQVLCVQQGRGALAFDGILLELIKPKTLPASD